MEDNIERRDFDLYYNGRVIAFDDGSKILERDKIDYKSTQPDIYHTVQGGDTLTYLAWKYYNKITPNASRYWKYIADVNNILNPLDISEYIGYELLIPNFNLIKLAE